MISESGKIFRDEGTFVPVRLAIAFDLLHGFLFYFLAGFVLVEFVVHQYFEHYFLKLLEIYLVFVLQNVKPVDS